MSWIWLLHEKLIVAIHRHIQTVW